MANAIRALAMDAVERAKSGHPGMPMGMADVATTLFSRVLKFDPKDPAWPDRDRFVLSAGHGSMLLYALLYLTGYEDMTIEEIRNFRQLGSRTPGHPEHGHAGGIETTTGPLGQGFANAVGMAIAERHMAARFGADLVDHRTFVVVGDGCLMEGISHEAASLAGHLRLGKLVALWDDNRVSIDGPTELAVSDDVPARFAAYGWATERVDGHDPDAALAALERTAGADRPTLIACRTTIGYGAPRKQGTAAAHGAPLGADEVAGARQTIGWSHAPFVVPDDVLAAGRAIGARGAPARAAWRKRPAAQPADRRATFERAVKGELPSGWRVALDAHMARLLAEPPTVATRKASEMALEALTKAIPDLVGGSADLTGSNNTKTSTTAPFGAQEPHGRYIHYGVREHAMAAAMNGMALHGGVVPYGGTFLVFTDYCRPAIRLSAIMGQRVVYVMTHDSIGLGEDGPTHQPIEHLASLRAMPNLVVLRPADAVETAEAWAIALERRAGPTVLALSRQNLPPVRAAPADSNRTARGGYVLVEAGGTPRVTLIGTGSEVAVALAARTELERDGVPTRVVSLPSWELFAAEDEAYRRSVIDTATVRVAVEAGATLGWERWVGPGGAVVGIDRFGASAPAGKLFEHFGITPGAVVAAARARLATR
ncbi:MAG: transketolase [Alphaproteobacteria bacterium]